MKSVFTGCILLLCFVTSTDANQGPTDVDYITRLENAHCLETINNMWLEKVSARGRKRTLTDSERKRNGSAVSSKWNQYRIYVGDQLDRWNEQKKVLRVQTHAEVAKILLDRVTMIIASTAGGMVLMVLLVLLVRCICLKCKKTPVRNIRPRGPPSYEESRRVYRLPAPPAYSPRDYPSHPPPAYETHLSLPGVAD